MCNGNYNIRQKWFIEGWKYHVQRSGQIKHDKKCGRAMEDFYVRVADKQDEIRYRRTPPFCIISQGKSARSDLRASSTVTRSDVADSQCG